MACLTACSEAGDARCVAIVSGQLISVLEKLGKISGEIATIANSVNVNIAILQHPEFARAQAVLLRALAPYPAARAACVVALRDLDAQAGSPPQRPAIEVLPPRRPAIEVLPPCPY